MHVTQRPGNVEDATRRGSICHEAFKTIAEQHNFPPDFPSPAVATELLAGLLAHPGFYPAFPGLGFLLPTRNGELFRWCLDHGLLVVQPMTLMSVGLYNEPAGAFLPSILY